MALRISATSLFLLAASAVSAASPEAWEAFRADIEGKCLAATTTLEDKTAWVDPFGTESYGIAVVTGRSRYADGRQFAVCVYDKATKTVETLSETDLQVLMPDR
ncbi:hypothetical protein [Nitratireductor sp. GCM10026969]|uniref:hypothetical protein n=1 Tax=Nitratireductor sp. GCM10026969 TaxID=3252645 RepID=UPI00360EB37B